MDIDHGNDLIVVRGGAAAAEAFGRQFLSGEVEPSQSAVGGAKDQGAAITRDTKSRHRGLWRNGERRGGQVRVGEVDPIKAETAEFPGRVNHRHKPEAVIPDRGGGENHLSADRIMDQPGNRHLREGQLSRRARLALAHEQFGHALMIAIHAEPRIDINMRGEKMSGARPAPNGDGVRRPAHALSGDAGGVTVA
ncbi:MAG: hypothetical protein ACPGVX_02215 [Thalassobaculaceae bacterium]